MTFVNDLISRNFSRSGQHVLVAGVSLATVAERFGTPVFVYDAGVLDRKLTSLRAALPGSFEISYSVKANPNKAILRRFVAKGCGLEIASGGEYQLASDAGCPFDRVVFAGPGKTESELELVLAKGIGELHVESLVEIDRIARLCHRLGATVNVALRINPTGEAEGGAMRMGGRATPFGVDEESADVLVDHLAASPALRLTGVHLFTGTQILDHEILLRQYQKGMAIAASVARRVKRPLATVDFGGGLGIPYFPHERELDLESLGQGLARLMESSGKEPVFNGTTFLLEPGRFLTAEAGIFMARVTDVKTSRGKTFVILDGGMNCHLAASGNLGQTIKRNYPIAVVNRIEDPIGVTADVVGPLCTPLDTLGRNVELPRPEVGDLVGVFQSGAYGLTASPVHFLSHPSPAEVMIDAGIAHLIRARGALTNLS
ncbi:MAG: type III PLP-dependent enzyme [Nitrospira sp.]|nr:type III PLP-dependent enzyme [Nitrospira sp.]